LRDGIAVDGLAPGDASGRLPPTSVRLASPGLIGRSWPDDEATTTRELRADGVLVFSVAHAAGVGYLLRLPCHGRFLVDASGTDVLCEPSPDHEHWSDGLAIQALPLACTLRGLEPFHASGVSIQDQALMITGPVTSGKSSLAAWLVRGGATLLSDDVVAVDLIDGVVRAHPGGRWLRLRSPEAEMLSAGRGRWPRPAESRRGRSRFEAPVSDGARPLRAIYLIAPTSEEHEPIAQLPASGVALLAATYNLSVREPKRLQRQLQLLHQLASRVPLFRLTVSPVSKAAQLAEDIRVHFEAQVLVE
jgi:hypothetical protein